MFIPLTILDQYNDLIIVVAVYFAPAIIAFARRHHNRDAIAIVNLFLGWTLIGWVVALALAATPVRSKTNA